MTGIFNFFGSILGYLLWWLYCLFQNYGVAILFFSIITKVVMFPLSIKQQKSMAAQSKLAAKQKEIQKKYANNKQKQSEEMQKLYDKEGVNPSAGCLTSLLPMPIMLGIFYSVIYPLSNTLHIAKETIEQATGYLSRIPGILSASTYPELELIRNFDLLRDKLTMFSAADLEKLDSFSRGFNFLGLDLLSAPAETFLSPLLIIPILSLIISFGQQFYMNRVNKVQQSAQTQQGCMKVMMYVFPLFMVYWAYIAPAAVGLYYLISGLTGFGQSIVTNKFFSVNHMTARTEAQRAVTLALDEEKIRPLPAATQKQIADKIEAGGQVQQVKDSRKNPAGAKKQRKKSGGSSNANQYKGSKK